MEAYNLGADSGVYILKRLIIFLFAIIVSQRCVNRRCGGCVMRRPDLVENPALRKAHLQPTLCAGGSGEDHLGVL